MTSLNIDNLLSLFLNLTDQEKTEFFQKINVETNPTEYAIVKITKTAVCKLIVYEHKNDQYIDTKYLLLENGKEYQI
jgi:hypothetical protein